MSQLSVLVAEPWEDYALLDSGGGRKLERYGSHRFIRPEPQALWRPAAADWGADGEFTGGADEEGGGRWTLEPALPARFELHYRGVRFHAGPTPFRHLGLFPDMRPQWDWMVERLRPGDELLNVFGYTGVASLLAAAAGAKVTHVDASKKAVAAARDNAALAGLADAPVRWLVDDALKFLRREARRGRRYHGILLDPPKYGRGPDGEIWDLVRDLPELVALARALAADGPAFVVLTCYAVRLSALALERLVDDVFVGSGGATSAGEMAVRETARGTLLPTAIFARWAR